MVVQSFDTIWRATGPYLPTNSSKAGLFDETRQFLRVLDERRDLEATRLALLDGGLLQRSRFTRMTILQFIKRRLFGWQPPAWVVDDLIAFARDPSPDALQAALLLHVCRQDTLLYDLAQKVIVPRWQEEQREISRSDVQRFLDEAASGHPEVETWTHATREKLAGNLLSILRDYGLLRGSAQKQIVEPTVPSPVAEHLIRLLLAEGISPAEIPHHPDWRLWLWDAERAALAQRAMTQEGRS